MQDRDLRFGLWCDFRNPPPWHRPWAEHWAELLDFFAWSETIGFDDMWFAEHHFTHDGYLPSPLVAAAALASRTKRIRLSAAIAILPLYHPVRLAEDGALVDVISDGRFELGVGLGYRPEEFAGFGIPKTSRGRRSDEALEIITRLWRGETVSFDGEHFQLEGARVVPPPVQQPRPPIWIGGFQAPAIRRAARFGDGVLPAYWDVALDYQRYRSTLEAGGIDVERMRIGAGNMYFMVSEDPERTFDRVAPHILYQHNEYAEYARTSGAWPMPRYEDVGALKASGMLTILTPDDCVKHIRELIRDKPIDRFFMMAPPPGMRPRDFADHVELFASAVIPHFR